MESAIVTTKGQIVIPSRIRRGRGIKKGTRVCFFENGNDLILRAVTDEYIDGIRGSLGSKGKALKALAEEKARERTR